MENYPKMVEILRNIRNLFTNGRLKKMLHKKKNNYFYILYLILVSALYRYTSYLCSGFTFLIL